MKCFIDGIYKGIKETKSGSFTDNTGRLINYNGGYKVIFDQVLKGIPKETELKVDKDIALNISTLCKPYEKIVIHLDITIYGNNNISVKVVSIEKK